MKTTILTTAIAMIFTMQISLAAADTTNLETSNECIGVCVNLYPNDVVEFRVSKEACDEVIFKISQNNKVKMYHKNSKKVTNLEVDCDVSNLESGSYICTVEKNGKEVLRKAIVIN